MTRRQDMPRCNAWTRLRFAPTWGLGAMALCAACGGSAPAPSSPSPPSTPSTAPTDTTPYGYVFEPVSPEMVRKEPPPPASLPTGPGGRLFSEAIGAVVRTHFDQIERCYDAGKRKNAKLAGVITVQSKFGRDGVPTEVTDEGSTLPDKETVDCVIGVFKALRYPVSRGGPVTFVYPIRLGSH
jgi:hypothetical protein